MVVSNPLKAIAMLFVQNDVLSLSRCLSISRQNDSNLKTNSRVVPIQQVMKAIQVDRIELKINVIRVFSAILQSFNKIIDV